MDQTQRSAGALEACRSAAVSRRGDGAPVGLALARPPPDTLVEPDGRALSAVQAALLRQGQDDRAGRAVAARRRWWGSVGLEAGQEHVFWAT